MAPHKDKPCQMTLTAMCSQAGLWVETERNVAGTKLDAHPQDLNHLFYLPDVLLSLCLDPPQVLHAHLNERVFCC